MASNSYCESCSGEGKSKAAIRFCSDFEEALCKECVEYHQNCKATKSHHLMDLTALLRSKISTLKKFYEVHEAVSLDFYCTQHDTEYTFSEWQNSGKTLDHLRKDRNDNVEELEKSESAICEEVNNLKNHLIKQINTLAEKVTTDLTNCKKKFLYQLRKEIAKISELYDSVQEREQQLEFLNDHGSNN
ncbi:unnamed protein product [Mytilus coruscus]|uniref:B box-type domain-containing protein n=1 Tax=Mytilus coruscus TaxID=42192 RepID=A0A6J8ESN2_MYTCO|nr:unnamed protein product [Mytilus coruscus]